MSDKIYEIVLKDLITYYLGLDDVSLQKHLSEKALATKERVKTINDLIVKIYPNDHNPPHFHVVSKNREIDAKFTIEGCELISGKISKKNIKKIDAFYQGIKGKIVLERIWKKYQG